MSQTEIIATARSKLVQKVLGEEASHIALRVGRFVIHSNIRGLHIEPLSHFLVNNKIADRISIKADKVLLEKLLDERWGSCYDYGAFLFMGLSFLARRYLRLPLPKRNLWQTSGMYLCTGWVSKYYFGRELEMLTPLGLVNLVRECKAADR